MKNLDLKSDIEEMFISLYEEDIELSALVEALDQGVNFYMVTNNKTFLLEPLCLSIIYLSGDYDYLEVFDILWEKSEEVYCKKPLNKYLQEFKSKGYCKRALQRAIISMLYILKDEED